MKNKIDFSTVFGIMVAFGLIGAAIYLGPSPESFIDIPSVLIVVCGTLAVTAACFSFREVLRALGLIFKTISYQSEDPQSAGRRVLELADEGRKNGLLSLQNAVGKNGSAFLHRAIGMTVDGLEPENVEKILRQDIQSRMERHNRGVSVLRKAAEIAPAMGLIGTLIGLVQMLGNLNEPDKIGPAMAVALLTTFYGAAMAYIVFNPLATKLERNSQEELLVAQLYTKGVAAIGRKENPRRIEMLLNTILPPEKRLRMFD